MKIFFIILLITGTVIFGKGILIIWEEGLYCNSNSILIYPYLGMAIMIFSLLALFIQRKRITITK